MGKPSEEAARPAKAVPWATQGAAKDRRAWIHSVCVKKKLPGKDNGKAHSVTKARVGWKGRRTRHRRTDKDVGSSLGSSPAVASCTTLPLSFSLGLPQLVRFLMHYRLGLCGAFECGGVVRVCLDVGVVYLQVAGDTPHDV